MIVSRLNLENFRNFPLQFCQFHPETNLIYGENAQGKTNLLESISFLSTGKSHRISKERELIRLGEERCVIELSLEHQREFHLKAEIHQNRTRKLEKNQVKYRNWSDFTNSFYTVLFCPEDLFLVKQGSVLRRRFLDTAMAQLRPNYAKAISEYKKIYQHKSQILKHQSQNLLETLPDFNLRMAQTGAMIIHYRAHFIRRLGEIVPQIHREFSGGKEEVTLEYKTLSTINDPLAGEKSLFLGVLDHQREHFSAELASRRCLTGPHKDDLILFINGLPARQFASQGQIRTLALSLKLAERELFFQETGAYPVLLLDDVLSELDKNRQEFVLNRIKSGQVFISCCQPSSVMELRGGASFQVVQGKLF